MTTPAASLRPPPLKRCGCSVSSRSIHSRHQPGPPVYGGDDAGRPSGRRAEPLCSLPAAAPGNRGVRYPPLGGRAAGISPHAGRRGHRYPRRYPHCPRGCEAGLYVGLGVHGVAGPRSHRAQLLCAPVPAIGLWGRTGAHGSRNRAAGDAVVQAQRKCWSSTRSIPPSSAGV